MPSAPPFAQGKALSELAQGEGAGNETAFSNG
jgi:hypothetical protein